MAATQAENQQNEVNCEQVQQDQPQDLGNTGLQNGTEKNSGLGIVVSESVVVNTKAKSPGQNSLAVEMSQYRQESGTGPPLLNSSGNSEQNSSNAVPGEGGKMNSDSKQFSQNSEQSAGNDQNFGKVSENSGQNMQGFSLGFSARGSYLSDQHGAGTPVQNSTDSSNVHQNHPFSQFSQQGMRHGFPPNSKTMAGGPMVPPRPPSSGPGMNVVGPPSGGFSPHGQQRFLSGQSISQPTGPTPTLNQLLQSSNPVHRYQNNYGDFAMQKTSEQPPGNMPYNQAWPPQRPLASYSPQQVTPGYRGQPQGGVPRPGQPPFLGGPGFQQNNQQGTQQYPPYPQRYPTPPGSAPGPGRPIPGQPFSTHQLSSPYGQQGPPSSQHIAGPYGDQRVATSWSQQQQQQQQQATPTQQQQSQQQTPQQPPTPTTPQQQPVPQQQQSQPQQPQHHQPQPQQQPPQQQPQQQPPPQQQPQQQQQSQQSSYPSRPQQPSTPNTHGPDAGDLTGQNSNDSSSGPAPGTPNSQGMRPTPSPTGSTGSRSMSPAVGQQNIPMPPRPSSSQSDGGGPTRMSQSPMAAQGGYQQPLAPPTHMGMYSNKMGGHPGMVPPGSQQISPYTPQGQQYPQGNYNPRPQGQLGPMQGYGPNQSFGPTNQQPPQTNSMAAGQYPGRGMPNHVSPSQYGSYQGSLTQYGQQGWANPAMSQGPPPNLIGGPANQISGKGPQTTVPPATNSVTGPRPHTPPHFLKHHIQTKMGFATANAPVPPTPGAPQLNYSASSGLGSGTGPPSSTPGIPPGSAPGMGPPTNVLGMGPPMGPPSSHPGMAPPSSTPGIGTSSGPGVGPPPSSLGMGPPVSVGGMTPTSGMGPPSSGPPTSSTGMVVSAPTSVPPTVSSTSTSVSTSTPSLPNSHDGSSPLTMPPPSSTPNSHPASMISNISSATQVDMPMSSVAEVPSDNGITTTASGTTTTNVTPSMSGSVTSVITTGPDGTSLDEASQQSTLSNASAASGEDQSSTPKQRKDAVLGSGGFHSHPPTPQSTVPSPGAGSLSSMHEEYGDVNSPSWPRTPASPVFNSHVPQDPYRSKKPDSLSKLYELDDSPDRRMWLDKLLQFMEERGTPITACPTISKNPLDLYRLYLFVKERAGFLEVTKNKTWKDIAGQLGIGASSSAAYTLRKHYTKNLLAYECHFDRGGIDPQPIINQVEATSKKKTSKTTSVPSPGSSNSQDSYSTPGSNSASMDGYGYGYPPGSTPDYNTPPMQRPASQTNAPSPHPGMQQGYQGQGGYTQYPSHQEQYNRSPAGNISHDFPNQQYPPGSGYPPNRSMYPPYGPEGDRSFNQQQGSIPGAGNQQGTPIQPSGQDPYNRYMGQNQPPGYPPRPGYGGPSAPPGPNQSSVPSGGYPGHQDYYRQDQISQKTSFQTSQLARQLVSSQSPVKPSYQTYPGQQTPAPGPGGTMYPAGPPSKTMPPPAPQPRRHPDFTKDQPGYPGYAQQRPVYAWPSNNQFRSQFPPQTPGGPQTPQWNQGPPRPAGPPSGQTNSQWDQNRFPQTGQSTFQPQQPQQQWGSSLSPPSIGQNSTLRPALGPRPAFRPDGKGYPMPPPTGVKGPAPNLPNTAYSQPKREIVFPPDSVEATTPVLYKRKRLTRTDIGPIEAWRLMMCLRSGLLAESCWALDVLNILLFDDSTVAYFGLIHMPGLLDVLLEHFRRSLVEMFDIGEDLDIGSGKIGSVERKKVSSEANKDRKWYEIPTYDPGEVDLGSVKDIDVSERVSFLQGPNYTLLTRKGEVVKCVNRDNEIFIMDTQKDWDLDDTYDNGQDQWQLGGVDSTKYILTCFQAEFGIVPFVRVLKDKKKECNSEECIKTEIEDIDEENGDKEPKKENGKTESGAVLSELVGCEEKDKLNIVVVDDRIDRTEGDKEKSEKSNVIKDSAKKDDCVVWDRKNCEKKKRTKTLSDVLSRIKKEPVDMNDTLAREIREKVEKNEVLQKKIGSDSDQKDDSEDSRPDHNGHDENPEAEESPENSTDAKDNEENSSIGSNSNKDLGSKKGDEDEDKEPSAEADNENTNSNEAVSVKTEPMDVDDASVKDEEGKKEKDDESLKAVAALKINDPAGTLKRKRMEDYEDECYSRDESSLYLVTETQDSLSRRCICVSNILRNLTFVPGNELEFAKSSGFLNLLGKLILLHHEHPLRTQKQRNYDREEDADFSDSCSSLYGESEWWWEYLHHIRENILVMVANIAGQMDLSQHPEEISRPILDGLLHWAVCPAAYGQDPFPTVGSSSVLSPQRLALEALCKLCVTEGNVDLVLATPPFSRLERLCTILSKLLCRSEDQVLREFAINLLHYFAAADSGIARTIALQNPCVSLLIGFIEQAEQNALNVVNHHGIQMLRENPESMGTSLDMLRRAANTLLHLSRHNDNKPLFLQQEHRLLSLVMSQILDQHVAGIISRVLFQCSRSEEEIAS